MFLYALVNAVLVLVMWAAGSVVPSMWLVTLVASLFAALIPQVLVSWMQGRWSRRLVFNLACIAVWGTGAFLASRLTVVAGLGAQLAMALAVDVLPVARSRDRTNRALRGSDQELEARRQELRRDGGLPVDAT